MRAVFFGTPAIAVPFLERLNSLVELPAVVSTPDQPAGRGYAVQFSPVKQAAQRLQKTLLQPEKLRDPVFLEAYGKLEADIGIVVAYGKLLPAEALDVPKMGHINVHFSLLPKYRGAAPIQWALINGEQETGVSLFWLDVGMDTGPLLLQKSIQIEKEDDAESLRHRLVAVGVEALSEAITLLSTKGKIAAPQNGSASMAPMLTKDDGKIRWEMGADQILNRMRGTTPWPGAFTLVRIGEKAIRLKILEAEKLAESAQGAPGRIIRLVSGQGIVIKCAEDLLLVTHVQPEGKRPMPAWDFVQGARLKAGDVLY